MKMYIFYCLDNFNIVYSNTLNPFDHFNINEEYKQHYGFAEVDEFATEPGLYRYNSDTSEAEFVGTYEEMENEFTCGDCPDLALFIHYPVVEHNTP